MKAWETEAPAVKVCDVRDFVRLKLPPRELLLPPWMESSSLAMLYAPRGVGKTHFAMHLAHALATGGPFMKWSVPNPVPVLYIDGEMPAPSMQSRWRELQNRAGIEPAESMLRIVSRDLQPFADIPNLGSPEGQAALSAQFGNARVVILDNLSSLIQGGKENEAESWEPVGQWAIRQRAQGRALLFVHHAGKSGTQRGTSKREDQLDVVINLHRPEDYRPEQGARFSVRFEKARSVYGADVAPFEAALINGEWAISDSGIDVARLRDLRAQGMSLSKIAAEIGCNKSTVSRRIGRDPWP